MTRSSPVRSNNVKISQWYPSIKRLYKPGAKVLGPCISGSHLSGTIRQQGMKSFVIYGNQVVLLSRPIDKPYSIEPKQMIPKR